MCPGGGVTPNRYHPARRTCIGSLPSGRTSAARTVWNRMRSGAQPPIGSTWPLGSVSEPRPYPAQHCRRRASRARGDQRGRLTPGDMWDYDEVGTHILIDGNVAGQARKLITHSARNGFLYTFDRFNGQSVLAKPYAGVGNLAPGAPLKKVCPSHLGGNNYWPSSYSPKTKLLYIPALSNCITV